ncbi:MAG: Nif3-like dinuclear metal center hexameric protein [Flavobacteriales bacterium]|nr:Nif3-like dinuclear metal center hexameric protein [Flavobacteriales bacterium]
MKLFEISNYLDTRVPLAFQEEYDNCGLLIGDKDQKINSVLISLDCTEEVLDEAIQNKHNLIVVHHPIIFQGVKKIIGANYVERIIKKAIKHDVAIYAMHTNLDNIYDGVSFQIAKRIGLKYPQILKPKTNLLTKLSVYCPQSHIDKVKNALFNSGAGKVGEFYDRCAFVSNGIGSFRPLDGASPFLGKSGKESLIEEDELEVVFYSYLKPKIISVLKQVHPYEEVAYTCVEIDNFSFCGSGVIGDLTEAVSLVQFLSYVKKKMNTTVIRYTQTNNKAKIQRVAVCGGAGSFLLQDAIQNEADVFISSDFKYHDFFDANNKISILDIGHYESEYFTQQLIFDIVKEKFSKLAVHLTKVCTNPILYY